MESHIFNWRDAGTYHYLEKLYADDLAWEFMRRNPDYQQLYEQSYLLDTGADMIDDKWGLAFFANPYQTSQEQAVFWRADVDSSVIPIVAAKDCTAIIRSGLLLQDKPIILHRNQIDYARRKDNCWYLIFSRGVCHLRAIYCGRGTYLDKPLIIPVLFSDDIINRIRTLEQFVRSFLLRRDLY